MNATETTTAMQTCGVEGKLLADQWPICNDPYLWQHRCTGDLDVLLLASALVGCCHAQDAVCVNVELDLDLGHTAGSWGDAVQAECAQGLVVTGKLTLTLQEV
jgi:hypothetical protein